MSEKLLATKVDFKLNNGKLMPAFGLGTANPKERILETKEAVKTAVKAGYRMIDTAAFYGTEETIGEALQELFKEGVVKREELFITTKVWPNRWDEVEESLELSLKKLQLDYVDLLLQHWPLCFPRITNPKTGDLIGKPKDEKGKPVYEHEGNYLETYKQMERIYLNEHDHKVRSIGVCNYSIDYLENLFDDPTIRTVPSVNQVELNPQNPQVELVKFCQSRGILMTGYSPLGSSGAPILKLSLIKELSEKLDLTTNEVVHSYLISKGIVVIPRSLNGERIKSNIYYKKLSKEQIDLIDNIGKTDPYRHIDEDFAAPLPGFTGRTPTDAE
ncbi:hypothetical protein ACO0RG_003964 [Hanseniaspora osmophila]|uniref:D-arabinose dehydrogenase [NAD(P)+] heavy chain n=1 Tax=Hanseniaspora osmophila TaxID=56408 RepID=A0A1E5RAR7_9ASCO|nr:D-arabinose dehydrogenase [NAD(P)+] heavy chain [Hanseniaspora osmophila]